MFRTALLAIVALLAPLPQAAEPPQSQPASAPVAEQPEKPPQLDSVFRELIQNAERSRPVQPITPERDENAAAGAPKGLLLEGRVLSDRSGVFQRVNERSEFEFSQPIEDVPTQRFELLPNSWLEAMERDAETGVSDFTITAEVTRYRGKNYLFLLKYRRQITHGNIRP